MRSPRYVAWSWHLQNVLFQNHTYKQGTAKGSNSFPGPLRFIYSSIIFFPVTIKRKQDKTKNPSQKLHSYLQKKKMCHGNCSGLGTDSHSALSITMGLVFGWVVKRQLRCLHPQGGYLGSDSSASFLFIHCLFEQQVMAQVVESLHSNGRPRWSLHPLALAWPSPSPSYYGYLGTEPAGGNSICLWVAN